MKLALHSRFVRDRSVSNTGLLTLLSAPKPPVVATTFLKELVYCVAARQDSAVVAGNPSDTRHREPPNSNVPPRSTRPVGELTSQDGKRHATPRPDRTARHGTEARSQASRQSSRRHRAETRERVTERPEPEAWSDAVERAGSGSCSSWSSPRTRRSNYASTSYVSPWIPALSSHRPHGELPDGDTKGSEEFGEWLPIPTCIVHRAFEARATLRRTMSG